MYILWFSISQSCAAVASALHAALRDPAGAPTAPQSHRLLCDLVCHTHASLLQLSWLYLLKTSSRPRAAPHLLTSREALGGPPLHFHSLQHLLGPSGHRARSAASEPLSPETLSSWRVGTLYLISGSGAAALSFTS